MSIHEKIVALANEKNKTSVPADCVLIQNMRPYPEGGSALNTAVDIVGILEKGYSGKAPLYYNRIEINRLFAGVNVSITVPFADVTTATVVAELNKLYPALQFDVNEFQLSIAMPGSPMFTLTSKSDSMMYLGSLIVSINYILEDISLDLTTTKLQGFTYQTE